MKHMVGAPLEDMCRRFALVDSGPFQDERNSFGHHNTEAEITQMLATEMGSSCLQLCG